MDLNTGSEHDRPDVIPGELQFEELELFTERQAELFAGGAAASFPVLNSILVQGLDQVYANLRNLFRSFRR